MIRSNDKLISDSIESRNGARKRLALSILGFYGLVFVFSWIPGLAMVWLQQLQWSSGKSLKPILLVLFGLGPVVAAILNTRIFRQQREFPVKPLLSRPKRFASSVLLAITLPVLFAMVTLATGRLFSANDPFQVPSIPLGEVLVVLGFSLMANPLEEFAWRGHAFRRLEQIFSWRVSALISGVLTTLWHWPLFWIGFGSMTISVYWLWSFGSVAFSVMVSFLFSLSGNCIWISILFHVFINTLFAAAGIPSFAAYAATSAVFGSALLLFAKPCQG